MGDAHWSRPPGRTVRLLLRATGLAAVAAGGWYLWWRWRNLGDTGAPGVAFLAVEITSWVQFATLALLPLRARWRSGPPSGPGGTLDVFVTVCGEPADMVERSVRAALAIAYPHRTYVLNDGRMAGKANWRDIEALAARLGVPCFTRTSGAPGKAGNLNHALARTDGEFVATIDADHVAEPDLAEQTLGYLGQSCERIGFVSTYQRFAFAKRDVLNNRDPLFYTLIQPAKDAAGCAISTGNGAVYRRAALDEIGGFSEWNLVEDLHTSYRLHAAGWTSVYHPHPVTTGRAPETAAEYLAQRQRWAMDSLRLLVRDCPLWRRGMRWRHRLHYFHTTASYLISFQQLVFLAASLGYAFTLTSLVRAPSQEAYLLHAVPAMSLLLLFLALGQRGLVNAVRGIQMLLFTSPLFAAAAVRVLFGAQPLRRMSRKHRERRFSSQLVAPLALLAVLTAGLVHLLWDGRPGVSPVGVFWVACPAFLLAGPAAMVTWRQHGSVALRTGLRLSIAGVVALAVPAAAAVPGPLPEPNPGGAPLVAGGAVDVADDPATRPPGPEKLDVPEAGAYFGVTVGELPPAPEAARWAALAKLHIVQWFQQWRSNETRLRPEWLAAVDRAGAVPMIVWEPWARPPGGYAAPDQPASNAAAIGSGRYDNYIRTWARGLAQYRRPVLIKFMHEMNGTWYPWSIGINGNTAAGYVQAWRHVHDLFREAGATNVSWVWSLNTEMGFARQSDPRAYFPGKEYVDWVGISGMNWGNTQTWSRWTGVDSLFRADYQRLRTFGKPIMITELATVTQGGDPAAWITSTLAGFRTSYPAVRAVVWFGLPYTSEVDFRLSPRARTAMAQALVDPYWKGAVRVALLDAPPALPTRHPPPYFS